MKIILSFKEVKEIKNIMESVETGSSKAFIDSLKGNKVITCNIDAFNQKVSINIKEEYVVDFLAVYGKYTQILISQAKVIKSTLETFGIETAKVIEKHVKNEKKVK